MKYIAKPKTIPVFREPSRSDRTGFFAYYADDLSYEELRSFEQVLVGIASSFQIEDGELINHPKFGYTLAAAWFNTSRVYIKVVFVPETGFYHIVKATSESPESIASDRGYPTIDAAFIEFSYQAGIVTPLESCIIMGIEEHAGDWDIAKCDCIRGNLPAVSAPGLLKEEIEKAKPQPTPSRPTCFGSFS